MPLPTTYAELQAAALDVIGRQGDAALTSYTPTAIGLVEAKLNRHFRTAPMETTVTLTGTSGLYALPSDFGGALLVEDTTYGPLQQTGEEWGASAYPGGQSGNPQYFTIQGGSLKTYPAKSGTLSLRYFKSIPSLSDSSPSNWLLASHPDAYLFLTVSELCAYTKDMEAALMWNQRGMQAVEEIKSQYQIEKYVNPAIRVRGPTP